MSDAGRSEEIRAGLRLIRVRRALLLAVFAAVAAAALWLSSAASAGNVVYLALGLGLLVVWFRYVGSRCPACQKPFFARGDSILRVWNLQPLRSSCANCGMPLGEGEG